MITTFINLFIHCTPSTQSLYCYLYACLFHILYLSVPMVFLYLSLCYYIRFCWTCLVQYQCERVNTQKQTTFISTEEASYSAHRECMICVNRMSALLFLLLVLLLVLLSPSPPLLLLLFFFQFRFIIFLRRLPVPPLCDVFCDRVVLYWWNKRY